MINSCQQCLQTRKLANNQDVARTHLQFELATSSEILRMLDSTINQHSIADPVQLH